MEVEYGKNAVKNKRTLFKKIWIYRWMYVMFLPVIAYYVIFHYAPMYGVTIAFKDYNMFQGVLKSPWVGLDNFKRIFSTSDFYVVLKNTLSLNLLSLILGFPGPIILAVLLNEIGNIKFKKVTQLVVYLPHFLSWVVVANIFIPMLSPNTGFINSIITYFGGDPIYFLGNKAWWIAIYVLTGIWKELGWGAIVYLAALTGIDQELYNAAKIDGANRWKQCLNITLPGIAPTISVLLILRLGGIMSIGFDQPFLLGNNVVIGVSDVISTYVYRIGLQAGDISRSTAIGFFQSVVCLVTLMFSNYLSKKISDQGIF